MTTRDTPQRREVVRALSRLQGFVSAQELHALIADGGGRIALATVYSQLKSLVRTGEVDAPDLEAWASEVGRRHGFHDLRHVLELSGVCDTCEP